MTIQRQTETRTRPKTSISVRIELGFALQFMANAPPATTFRYSLGFDLSKFALQMGLEFDPEIAMVATDAQRALCLYLHDRLCPYPPELMRQAWLIATPRKWADVERFSDQPEYGYPDGWVSNYARDPDGAGTLWVFLRYLCLGAVKRQPGCLLNGTTLAHYLVDEPEIPLEYARPILRQLLETGISLRDREVVLGMIKRGIAESLSNEVIAQQLVARLRKPQVEIRANAAYWRSITQNDLVQPINALSDKLTGETTQLMRVFLEGYYYETGIYPPEIALVPSPEVPDEHVVIVVNDVDSIPFRCLPPDKILVNGVPVHLANEGIIIAHPSNYRDSLIVEAKHQDDLEHSGTTTWTPIAFIVLIAYNYFTFLGHWLLSVDDVEFMLAKLEEVFPDLIQAILVRFAISDIAYILQELAREGVSIRNLPDILTQLLLYDGVQIDTGRYIIFDDRLTLSPLLPSAWLHHWRGYLTYTRNHMKAYISHKYTRGQMTLRALLLSAELERRLLATELGEVFEEADQDDRLVRYERFTDRELCRLRTLIWEQTPIWHELYSDSIRNLCILTETSVRAIMRRVIEPEILNMPVLSYTELDPSLSIEPLGRIESWEIE